MTTVATLATLSAWELALLIALFGELFILIAALFPRVGILKLELAGSASAAQAVVDDWRRRGLVGAARRSIYVDFPFIVVYSTLLALLVVLAERAAVECDLISEDTDWVGVLFVLVALAAGACDLLENGALFGMLSEDTKISGARARTAQVLALAKFLLVAVALLWIVVVLVACLLHWLG